ncbi:MAG TPA: hypothetical protein VNK67_11885 [Burkholderiales bacterium]|nr:hypothetical protein [Burkholderiales bacterium]
MPRPKPVRWMLGALALALCAPSAGQSPGEAPEVARARYLWSQSPHGKLLERILPRAIEPHELPEPKSEGARLATRYCVQCHYLPNPRMHTALKWKTVVDRMYWRMLGKGNLGGLMKEMMEDVEAPSERELGVLVRYLQRHAMKEIDPRHPALRSGAGQVFGIACSQCHALPDPRLHTAREWPQVVERMQRHIAWHNVVVGADELKTVPVLDTGEIVRLLQHHARPDKKGD